MNKKLLTTLLLVVLCAVMVLGGVVSAAEPYQTYTYSSDGEMLWSPTAYSPIKVVDSNSIGLEIAFDDPGDLFVDTDGKVYLTDVKNNRVIILKGSDYSLDFMISEFEDSTGVVHSLSGPKGVFVHTDAEGDKHIYVCDTKNSRLVVFDENGGFERIISKPTSTLFGTDTLYNPIACAVDQYGRIFVISSSSYQGVIVLTPEGEFTSFIGAQKVSYDLFTIIWRRFQTKEQRQSQESLISTEFNNISIDAEGFIYVTTNTIKKNNQQSAISSKSADYAPVKKLNSAGVEIMKRNGFFAPGGEVDVQNFSTDETVPIGASSIVDVAIGPAGTWSIVDQTRSKIFTYDANGNLLFAFGDKGTQQGNHQTIGAIVYQGSYLLVLDTVADSFTVLKRTEYGDLLIQALEQEINREYDKAIYTWGEVLKYNNNFDAAYVGLGQSYARQGEYEKAMQYFEAAYDTENWSEAYKEVRKEWIEQFFILIPLGLIVLCVGIWLFLRFAANFNHKTALNGRVRKRYGEELMYCFHLMFHPFDGFWDLKHERRGSLRAALTILAVVIVCFYYQAVGTGYVMNPMGSYSTIFTQILSVGLPLILWVVGNWCLTTLFEGEGSLKDITIATCYSLSPMAFILIGTTIASNFVSADESAIVTLVITFGYIWVGLLLFCGMMVTHDYSFTKNLLMTVSTIVGMAVIMFVGFLFSSLVGKMVSFISSIITEITYRL